MLPGCNCKPSVAPSQWKYHCAWLTTSVHRCVDTALVGGGISRSSGCQIGFHEIGKATHDYKRMISTSWKPVCAAGASDAETDFFGFCLESCVAHALGCQRAYVLNNGVLYALIAFSNVATLVMSQLKLQPSVCLAEWI